MILVVKERKVLFSLFDDYVKHSHIFDQLPVEKEDHYLMNRLHQIE
jgi:hypothetical protein